MGIAEKVKGMVRLDGWFNLLSNLGVAGKDKRVALDWDYTKLTEIDCETLYASDDIAGRLIDKLPEDALREWVEHQNIDTALKDGLQKKCESIGARMRLEEAWKWGRMYGGSGIYINVNDGRDPQEPVDEENIQDVTSLTVLSRYELIPYQINSNIESPYFGEPAIYRLQTSQPTDFVQRYIHHSRILRFDGDRLPRRLRIQNQWWGQSIYVKTLETIKDYHTAHKSSVAALADFSVGVTKMKNLHELISTPEGEKLIKTRLEIMNYSKSMLRTILIDAEDEEFQYVNRQLNGVKDIVDHASGRYVTASQMPHTIALGEGAQGLGSDGKSEQRDWYDFVSNQQELVLKPRLDTLFRYIFLSKRGLTGGAIPQGWSYDFIPLWQLDDTEKADVRLKTSQADASDIMAGILDPNEVAKSRYGGTRYSTDTKLDETVRNSIGAAPALNPSALPTDQPAPTPDPKLVSPAQDPYQPQGATNGAHPNPVVTPSPGFLPRTDDSDGMVTDTTGKKSGENQPRRVLQSIKVHKHTVKTEADAKDLAEEYGGRVNGVDESTDAYTFRQRDPKQFEALKAFSPPKHPHVTLVYGEHQGDSQDMGTNEPTFEQANKNYSALWSWNETPDCGPDGSGCLNVQQ